MEVVAVPDERYYTREKLFIHRKEKLPHVKRCRVEGGATRSKKMTEKNNKKELMDTTI